MRVATMAPDLHVGDCDFNALCILNALDNAVDAGASLVVFPELSLCGATLGDMLCDAALLASAEKNLAWLLEQTHDMPVVFVVGLPVAHRGVLYNCAAVCAEGALLGLTAKDFTLDSIGNQHIFAPVAQDLELEIEFAQTTTCLSTRLVYELPESFGMMAIVMSDDFGGTSAQALYYAAAGASILVHPSAMPDTIGSITSRFGLIDTLAQTNHCAYIFANAGVGESTTDYVFSGTGYVSEAGEAVVDDSQDADESLALYDIDTQLLEQVRLITPSVHYANTSCPYAKVSYALDYAYETDHLCRKINPAPFFVSGFDEFDSQAQAAYLKTIFELQVHGLVNRMRKIGTSRLVLGVSGGLDSTLALFVAVAALEQLGLPTHNLKAISMPGFGTTQRTRGNAQKLAVALGCDAQEILIHDAVNQHFADIDHDPQCADVVFENSQARERTQILMDIANQVSGLVVGTGDMSELALGWATYNGDQMSMYSVNANIPKTIVRALVEVISCAFGKDAVSICKDILATPISPELLPVSSDQIEQATEDLVGPYELHDFFMYQLLTYRFSPVKIFKLACLAFKNSHEPKVIAKWLRVFYRRFFMQQFKRTCMPDGPSVFDISLSPRGGWKMPSDASAAIWLAQIDSLL